MNLAVLQTKLSTSCDCFKQEMGFLLRDRALPYNHRKGISITHDIPQNILLMIGPSRHSLFTSHLTHLDVCFKNTPPLFDPVVNSCWLLFPRSSWTTEDFLSSAQSYTRSLLLGRLSQHLSARWVHCLLWVRSNYCICRLGSQSCCESDWTLVCFRGKNQGQDGWRPCLVNATGRHCDIDQPGFWQATHVLRVTETNALGSQTTLVLFKLHELCKIHYLFSAYYS